MTFTFPWQSVTQFVTSRHALAGTRCPALYSTSRSRDEFKAAKNTSLLFYEKVKQRKLACGIRIVLHNVERLCLLLLLNNYQVFMLIIWREKKLPGQTCTYFQCIFCNSFVTYFILTRMYVIRTLQIRIKIMLN